MKLSEVAAVIVTRGDVDLGPVLKSLPFDKVVVWNNAKEPDFKVYGRYMAISMLSRPYIYVQDDDCICPAAELAAAYEGESLLLNVPEDENSFVGWGAIFPRSAPFNAFGWYETHFEMDEFFHLWADVVFAELTPHKRIDLGHEDLPWASSPTRMYQQPTHYIEQERMRQRCRLLSA